LFFKRKHIEIAIFRKFLLSYILENNKSRKHSLNSRHFQIRDKVNSITLEKKLNYFFRTHCFKKDFIVKKKSFSGNRAKHFRTNLNVKIVAYFSAQKIASNAECIGFKFLSIIFLAPMPLCKKNSALEKAE